MIGDLQIMVGMALPLPEIKIIHRVRVVLSDVCDVPLVFSMLDSHRNIRIFRGFIGNTANRWKPVPRSISCSLFIAFVELDL